MKKSTKERPRVLVVGTGGEIVTKTIGPYWRSGEFIQDEILKLVPEIKAHVETDSQTLFRMHSADMHPEKWLSLSQFIYYQLPEVDGIVVTHGTDTMVYTSAMMAFLIQNLNVPIVFTGSQAAPMMMGGDAKTNLIDAIRVAADADLAETVIVFDRKIIRAVRARKINACQYDSYESNSQKRLGVLQQEILLEGFQERKSRKKPVLSNDIESSVGIVKMRPGISPRQLEYVMNTGLKGIVIEGYGLGNIPMGKDNMKQAINNISKSGIPVVLTSDCELGIGWQNFYKSEIVKRLSGVDMIEGYDMTTECALVKLMWVLGQTKKVSKVKKMMQHNYVGEISKNLNVLSRKGMWERRL